MSSAVATFVQGVISDNVITDHSNAGITAFTVSTLQGGVHAVVARNAVRGLATAKGINASNSNTEVLLEDNVVSQTSQGVVAASSAIVRSRGNNMVDDNTTNQSGAVTAANSL